MAKIQAGGDLPLDEQLAAVEGSVVRAAQCDQIVHAVIEPMANFRLTGAARN
jgi:hypothetical protein